MRREALSLSFISVLLFAAVAGALLIPSTDGNVMIGIVKPVVKVISPTNATYATNQLSLLANFTTYTTGLYDGGPRYEETRAFTYSLDGGAPKNLTITDSKVGMNPGSDVFFEGQALLRGLAEGTHNLTVRVAFNYSSFIPSESAHYYSDAEATTLFTVVTSPDPDTAMPNDSDFRTPVAVGGISVFVVAAVLIYYLKRKR